MPRSHYSVSYRNGEKNTGFCETVHSTPHKNVQKRAKTRKNEGFQKRSSKWIFTKTEVFENAVDQCERTKTDKNKNAITATTKYFTHFSQNSTFNLKKAKTYEMEYIKFC